MAVLQDLRHDKTDARHKDGSLSCTKMCLCLAAEVRCKKSRNNRARHIDWMQRLLSIEVVEATFLIQGRRRQTSRRL